MTWVNQSDSTPQGSSTQTANTVASGPVSGGAAAPTYRALVAADIPATWTTPAFNAANFTAFLTMTWTVAIGNVVNVEYTVIGKQMTLIFVIGNTTIGGTPSAQLRMAVPGGFTIAKASYNTVNIRENGVRMVGMAEASAGLTFISFYRDVAIATNWTLSAGNADMYGQITFEVV